jgi:eukaryotic translation initiation factor 2C
LASSFLVFETTHSVIEPESDSVAFNIKVIQHLQTQVAPEIFDPVAAYDGRKNMFAARDLPLGPTDSGSVSQFVFMLIFSLFY